MTAFHELGKVCKVAGGKLDAASGSGAGWPSTEVEERFAELGRAIDDDGDGSGNLTLGPARSNVAALRPRRVRGETQS